MGLRFKLGQVYNSTGAPGLFTSGEGGNGADFDGYAVTPADGTDLPNGECDAIYVTGAGNINVNLNSIKVDTGAIAGTATLTSLAANSITLVSAQRILSTSTTATGIYALYRRG